MKKTKVTQADYKKRISDLIQNSFIQSPNDYNFRSDKAVAFLNRCANEINKNYAEIVLLLGNIFNNNDNAFDDWLSKFNTYLFSNKDKIMKMDYSVGYDSVYLTSDSIKIFSLYIDGLNNLVSELSGLCSRTLNNTKRNPVERNVFIVHGHDIKLRDSLKKSLIKNNYEPIILSDMNDSGVALFDKFEKYANRCMKAIILMTSDDSIIKKDEHYYQCRPNVLIEYGYFLNMMDKHDIVVLLEKGCKKPSDIDGISYIEYNGNTKSIVKKVIDSLNLH